MSRPIMFSKVFLKGHPREGELTEFRSGLYRCLYEMKLLKEIPLPNIYYFYIGIAKCKSHTIRAGHRWKVGDFFSPREWSGKPYRSKHTILFDDIQIVKIWDIRITDNFRIFIDGVEIITYEDLAHNDGLTLHDFMFWFAKSLPFDGQIICWNKDVDYTQSKYYFK